MSLAGAVIVFDLDGTLVDTAPDLIGALNAVLVEEGLPPVGLGDAKHLVGKGAKAMLERGFQEAGATLDPDKVPALFDRYIDIYRARIAQQSTLFEQLEPTLDLLHAEGAILAVCTNKRSDLAMALMNALDLTRHFAAIVGAGGEVTRALMVGDSISDVRSAQAAGVHCVLVSFGYTDIPVAELGADALIDHFTQLPAIARRLLAGTRIAKPQFSA